MRLTPFARADEDVLLAMFRDAGVRRFLLDGVLVERDWVRAEIEASMRRFSEGSLGIFLARDRIDDEPVGFAGFRPFREPPVLELSYGLSPGHWGRGFATEMSRAMLALAFDRHGLDAVDTAVDAPNVASLRVLRRSAARPAPSERRSTSGLRAPTGIGAMPREACTHER